MDVRETGEITTRKISMTQICGVGTTKDGWTRLGFEYAPPKAGEHYIVLLGRGRVFRTSPFATVERGPKGVIIRTGNSVYEVMYLS